MKKWLIYILAGTLAWSMTACGTKQAEETGGADEEIGSAVALLETVWDSYEEEERFSAAGGDYDHSVMDAPGTFDISNTEMLEMMLYVPQDAADQIDDAALLMHMMNVNTFTAGSFHMADGADREAFASVLEENIMNTEWMCGFPDQLVIAAVGEDYLVSAFGNEELIANFEAKLQAAFGSAKILYEETITE